MVHEILIPFRVNTDPIEAMVEVEGKDKAREVIKDVVIAGLKKAMPKSSARYRDGDGIDWNAYANSIAYNWFDKHKEEIIDEAALLLAQRAGRTKAWRDVLAEIKSEEGKRDGES